MCFSRLRITPYHIIVARCAPQQDSNLHVLNLGIRGRSGECCEAGINLAVGAGVDDLELQSDGTSSRFTSLTAV
jgi:hypothetical protein